MKSFNEASAVMGTFGSADMNEICSCTYCCRWFGGGTEREREAR